MYPICVYSLKGLMYEAANQWSTEIYPFLQVIWSYCIYPMSPGETLCAQRYLSKPSWLYSPLQLQGQASQGPSRSVGCALSSLAPNSPHFSGDASPLTPAALCLPSVVVASLKLPVRALEPTSTKISQISKNTTFHVLRC